MFLTIFAIVVAILIILYKKLSPFFIIVFLILIFLMVCKVIKQYKTYGKSIFRIFEKRKEVNYDEDTIINTIKQTNTYYKMVKLDDSISKFIIVNGCGVYAYYVINYKGFLYGSINDKDLKLKTSIKHIKDVDNILKPIMDDLKDAPFEVTKILITRTSLAISVDGFKNVRVIKTKDIFYNYIKDYKNNCKYSDLEVDDLYKEISSIK